MEYIPDHHKLYINLLQQYLNYFIPLKNFNQNQLPLSSINLSLYGQLFVQILIDFWFNQNIPPYYENIKNLKGFSSLNLSKSTSSSTSTSNSLSPTKTINTSSLEFSSDYYLAPTILTIRSCILLVKHIMILIDAEIELFKPNLENILTSQNKNLLYNISNRSILSISLLSTLQKPLYNFLYLTFMQYSLESETPFYLVL